MCECKAQPVLSYSCKAAGHLFQEIYIISSMQAVGRKCKSCHVAHECTERNCDVIVAPVKLV